MDFLCLSTLGTKGIGLALSSVPTGITTSMIGGGLSFGWFKKRFWYMFLLLLFGWSTKDTVCMKWFVTCWFPFAENWCCSGCKFPWGWGVDDIDVTWVKVVTAEPESTLEEPLRHIQMQMIIKVKAKTPRTTPHMISFLRLISWRVESHFVVEPHKLHPPPSQSPQVVTQSLSCIRELLLLYVRVPETKHNTASPR